MLRGIMALGVYTGVIITCLNEALKPYSKWFVLRELKSTSEML